MLLLAPPIVVVDPDPDIIGVHPCALLLDNPEQVALNIQRSLKGLRTNVIKEVDGVRGVLSEFDQGSGANSSTVLALMLPTSTGCVQFVGVAPRAQFAAHRAHYERIIFSVRRAP